MLELHDVSKRYGDRPALDAVSFTVGDGRLTGFVGGNGAGFAGEAGRGAARLSGCRGGARPLRTRHFPPRRAPMGARAVGM
ncbi:hypothetical protein J7E29_07940 [Streptomyces sp. ISL-90]|nr:hypothetical protein [Streptomyces sp. ISL-90]